MDAIYYIGLGGVIAYALLLLAISVTMFTGRYCKRAAGMKRPALIIPFRNEGRQLERCFKWAESERMTNFFDLVAVNDHSQDFTRSELNALRPAGTALLHMPPGETGKKRAIMLGMHDSHSEWAVTADTDTWIDPNLPAYIPDKPGKRLYITPVVASDGNGLIGAFFALEFMALQGVGCAFAKWGHPVLANGACLIVHRTSYIHAAARRTDWDIPGGDDIYALHAMVSTFGKESIGLLIPKRPFADSIFPQGIRELFNQRKRWVAKVPIVKATIFGSLAWFVLIINVLIVSINISLLLSGWQPAYGPILVLKYAADFVLIAWSVLYFRRLKYGMIAPLAVVLYPFYLVVLVLGAAFTQSKWK